MSTYGYASLVHERFAGDQPVKPRTHFHHDCRRTAALPALLPHLPRPLLNQIVSGRCVPIIGAGFSRNADSPQGAAPPLWNELGDILSEDLQDYKPNNVIDALSAYERQYSRRALVEALSKALLIGVAIPGNVHRTFCEIPFDLVVTTNIDFLLELGYAVARRYCRPILNEDELGVDAVSPRVDLLKLHGDLHNSERLIVTEEDYDSFLTRYPLMATYIGNLLISKTALFIGYSLEDNDFRQIWQVIKDRLGRMRREAYTITVGASSHSIARFERRGVHVVNLPGTERQIGMVLAQLFSEIREAWTAAVPRRSIITEEEPLAEFSVPASGTNRLCFFSLPVSLVSLYREVVFPIAQDAGFVPISAVDVITQGDSITAKITALIERAQLLVFDLSSEAPIRELNLAFSRRWESSAAISPRTTKIQHTLIVLSEGASEPPLPQESAILRMQVIRRPRDLSANTEEFVGALQSFFSRAALELKPDYEGEPERLLAERHPEAALITAFTLLEREIRSNVEVGDNRHRLNIRDLLILVRPWISDDDWKKLHDVVVLRNRVVHGDLVSLDQRRARSAVALLSRITQTVRTRIEMQ